MSSTGFGEDRPYGAIDDDDDFIEEWRSSWEPAPRSRINEVIEPVVVSAPEPEPVVVSAPEPEPAHGSYEAEPSPSEAAHVEAEVAEPVADEVPDLAPEAAIWQSEPIEDLAPEAVTEAPAEPEAPAEYQLSDLELERVYEQGLIDAREAAEETVRVKSAFLASMSHEIRTPLTAVLGFAEILRDEVPEEQRDLVEAIEAGGLRLLSTLNSVLDLARLDAGREMLRPADVDLVGHIGQGVRLLGALAARKGLDLRFAPAVAALPACIDTGALDRILTNLVGNAIKFTDVGGVTVTLAPDPLGRWATLAVSDTGIGMSTEFLPEVFNEFRQESEG